MRLWHAIANYTFSLRGFCLLLNSILKRIIIIHGSSFIDNCRVCGCIYRQLVVWILRPSDHGWHNTSEWFLRRNNDPIVNQTINSAAWCTWYETNRERRRERKKGALLVYAIRRHCSTFDLCLVGSEFTCRLYCLRYCLLEISPRIFHASKIILSFGEFNIDFKAFEWLIISKRQCRLFNKSNGEVEKEEGNYQAIRCHLWKWCPLLSVIWVSFAIFVSGMRFICCRPESVATLQIVLSQFQA